ncbi:hypothetical protein EVG20_g6319 [Dentipellis fragilis]|uniref:Uncharacterized protein n=1 Tax=Dentipellis fragilis TaxID=205917 RepID=A0A4Y9YNP4_9AGAM|nr:hypothetical protein EVG20_g6319 [Dentipellis fragilis]
MTSNTSTQPTGNTIPNLGATPASGSSGSDDTSTNQAQPHGHSSNGAPSSSSASAGAQGVDSLAAAMQVLDGLSPNKKQAVMNVIRAHL